jgi:phage host-nuclease inhibitor protein Gam
MTKRVKKKSVPGADYTRDEATEVAIRIAAVQIERERLVAERDAAKEAAAKPYREVIEDLDAVIESGMARLEAWARANKADFGEARSLVLPGGNRVGWRLGNWTAKTRKGWTWEKVREAIEGLSKGWRDAYLRIKVDVAKDAIIADREKVDWAPLGVTFAQGETFYLEPQREEGGRIA